MYGTFEFPEPLFESYYLEPPRRMCLVCAKRYAKTVLRTSLKDVVPLCEDCGSDWNCYGYGILKRIKPKTLIKRILLFKVLHLFQKPSFWTIWRDVKGLQEWAKKMKKWM